MAITLKEGVTIEKLGDEVLVSLPQSKEVLTLRGDAAEVITAVSQGKGIDLTTPVAMELVDRGVLRHDGVSRRTILATTVAGAAGGIAVLSLPTVAAASSAIAIQGLYYIYDLDGVRYLEVQIPGTQGAPAVDFPEGQGNPTALTVSNVPPIPLLGSPVTQYDASATIDSNFAYDRATWRIDVAQSTALTATFGVVGDPFPTSGDTLTATFTWGTFSYVATLTYYDPPRG